MSVLLDYKAPVAAAIMLQMIVNAHTMSNVLHIKIIGADKGKGPVLFLQLLYEVLNHLQIPTSTRCSTPTRNMSTNSQTSMLS